MSPVLSNLKKKDMEIKPQDLRVGNAVLIEGVLSEVHTISQQGGGYEIINGHDPSDVEGIELTPEWLDRFGFEYAEGFADDYTKQPITVYNNPFKVGWTVENLFNQQIKEDILVLRYVHQLQNLYFALTGEELAIDKQLSNGN